MACFLSRLPAGLARTALASVETAAAAARDMPASAAEAEYPWNLYFDFVGMLQDRVAKVGGRVVGGREVGLCKRSCGCYVCGNWWGREGALL